MRPLSVTKIAGRRFSEPRPKVVTTSKTIIGLSVVFLTFSALFGVLNTKKTRSLRAEAERSETAREEAERGRLAQARESKAREARLEAATAKPGGAQANSKTAESDLIKWQAERAELQAKLQANETEIAELRKKIEDAGSGELIPSTLPAPPASELQAQLEEAKQQLDTAEREKEFLTEKLRGGTPERPVQIETEKKRRVAGGGPPGVRGTVLAVNQAYNFVVLNLGGRQGIEANSEMLVLRGGTLIGKIRVSSVEPATAIGDIITNSLARGVQVQPGDTVIYAGSNS